jgi:hypothetical protein
MEVLSDSACLATRFPRGLTDYFPCAELVCVVALSTESGKLTQLVCGLISLILEGTQVGGWVPDRGSGQGF